MPNSLAARPATQDDVERWYEGSSPSTARAWVVTLDGRVVGLAGLALHGRPPKYYEAFAEVGEELKPHLHDPVVQWAISRVVRMIRSARLPVVALADPELETAVPLLTRLGAVPAGDAKGLEVYQWRK